MAGDNAILVILMILFDHKQCPVFGGDGCGHCVCLLPIHGAEESAGGRKKVGGRIGADHANALHANAGAGAKHTSRIQESLRRPAHGTLQTNGPSPSPASSYASRLPVVPVKPLLHWDAMWGPSLKVQGGGAIGQAFFAAPGWVGSQKKSLHRAPAR